MKLNIYYVGHNTMYNNFYKTCDLQDCYNYLKDKEVISIDIETSYKFNGKYNKEFELKWGKNEKNPNKEGLDPYLSNIVMFQIGDEERQYIIDYRDIDISLLKTILESKNILKVGHNIKFEYKHILHNNNIRLNNVYDTMIVEQILFTGIFKPNGLKDLVERYLSIQIEKDTRLEFSNISNKPFTLKQIEYGAKDILYPILIRKQQIFDINQKQVQNCVNLEMLFLQVLGDIEYKGMHFDTNIWLDTYNNNLIKFNELENKLNDYVINNHSNTLFIKRQLDLFNPEIKCDIQWTSSKQVIDLFVYLNICPKEVSKTTNKLSYTVNGKVLLAHLNNIENQEYKDLINLYLKYKETEQSVTTFGKAFFKYINPITNRLHSNYKQILNTGRISSSNPNLQNIPADLSFRKAFNCKEEYKIVNADYSGQEQIILANKSNDKDLIYFYEQGLGDMHSYIASKIFPELNDVSLEDIKKHHKDKRQIAKAAGFSINYGGNGYTISKNLGIPLAQGEAVYNAYFKAFPNLKNYFKTTIRNTFRRGYILIDPLTGRKNWFKPYFDNKSKGKIERNALNYPIQGEAGGITKYAPVLFRKWILDNNLQDVIFITNLVHDEINLEVKEEYAELAAKNLEKCMKESADKWCKIVKLKADAVITDYWNH